MAENMPTTIFLFHSNLNVHKFCMVHFFPWMLNIICRHCEICGILNILLSDENWIYSQYTKFKSCVFIQKEKAVNVQCLSQCQTIQLIQKHFFLSSHFCCVLVFVTISMLRIDQLFVFFCIFSFLERET